MPALSREQIRQLCIDCGIQLAELTEDFEPFHIAHAEPGAIERFAERVFSRAVMSFPDSAGLLPAAEAFNPHIMPCKHCNGSGVNTSATDTAPDCPHCEGEGFIRGISLATFPVNMMLDGSVPPADQQVIEHETSENNQTTLSDSTGEGDNRV